MPHRIYLASLEPRAGRSLVTLGVMELLSRRAGRVGYFRPIIGSSQEPDARIELIRRRYGLDERPEDLWAYGADQVSRLMAEGRSAEVFKHILEASKRIEDRYDLVVYDGTDYTGSAAALEFEVNAQIANHLGAPVLALVNGADRLPDQIRDAVRLVRESLTSEGCTIAATVANRVHPDLLDDVQQQLTSLVDRNGDQAPVWALPEVPMLRLPTVRELIDALGADEILGTEADLDREVSEVKIAAMTIPNLLDHVHDGTLLMVPGDRADVVAAALLTRIASTYPNLAAVVLTGGLSLHPNIERLLDGVAEVPMPILAVPTDSYTTAQRVSRIPVAIRPGNQRKIDVALKVFEDHVDTDELARRIQATRSSRVTPLMFEYELQQRAKAVPAHIVLPEGTDERILRATEILRRRDVVDLTLLGDPDEVRARADTLGIDLGDVAVVDPAESEWTDEFAETYRQLRAHKGITPQFAAETVLDVSYFGTLMVDAGLADGMVSGAAHTTQHTIRPAFEIIRTAPGVSLVSSVFLMLLEDRVLVYGDCAVNPQPEASGLADIAISSAATAEQFGIDPRIAMLSYSTGESGKGQAVETVREATALVRERRPDLEVDGPIQYDAAVDLAVGRQKLPGSSVAGRATVFIFPDLNTGNNTYKAVQRSAGAIAIGPVLQGLNRPVNDLSRGALVDDVVNTVMITAVQAQQSRPDAP